MNKEAECADGCRKKYEACRKEERFRTKIVVFFRADRRLVCRRFGSRVIRRMEDGSALCGNGAGL